LEKNARSIIICPSSLVGVGVEGKSYSGKISIVIAVGAKRNTLSVSIVALDNRVSSSAPSARFAICKIVFVIRSLSESICFAVEATRTAADAEQEDGQEHGEPGRATAAGSGSGRRVGFHGRKRGEREQEGRANGELVERGNLEYSRVSVLRPPFNDTPALGSYEGMNKDISPHYTPHLCTPQTVWIINQIH
jgi:hypothetical protein